jgi:hypothetical protein
MNEWYLSQGALARPWAVLFHPYRGVKPAQENGVLAISVPS